MRLFPLIIALSFGLPLWADDIPSGPGDPKTGQPSGTCGDKKNLTIINFRNQVGDDKTAVNDCQLVKHKDGWHFNYFEGEDIYMNDDGVPCVQVGDPKKIKPACGDQIGQGDMSWRDKDLKDAGSNAKRTHHTKLTYKDGSLTIQFLKDDGKTVDESVPYISLSGKSANADKTKGHPGNMSLQFIDKTKHDPKLEGSIDAHAEQDGQTPVAPEGYIPTNKLDIKPQTGTNAAAVADKTKMPDPKSICEAQGIGGWTSFVREDNVFQKNQNQDPKNPGGKLTRWGAADDSDAPSQQNPSSDPSGSSAAQSPGG